MRAPHRTSIAGAVVVALLTGCAPEAVPDAATGASSTPPATSTSSPTATTTPDPYVGYFEDRAAQDAPARTSFWGSFGDVGGVAGIRNEDRTLPPGRYDVEVVCAGPPTGVDVTLTSIADETLLRDVNVPCTADGIVGRIDTIESSGQGLRIELDSRGSAGAFLVNVRDAAA